MDQSLKSANDKMQKALEHFEGELKKIRTGRANPQMLEGVKVEVYGQDMPLQHVANINAVDAQLLMITPFDPNNIEAISRAIREDRTLGLNPADDGKVVRVPIPPLTTERRQEIAKQVHAKAEECRISLRTVRHDLINEAKQQNKDNEITEDEYHRVEKQANELIDNYQSKVETSAKNKEEELMSV